jgi:LysR family transcriptional regulator of abg operon
MKHLRQFKLEHLRAFLAVAEAGSIRGAARRLGVSQPGLTKIIRQLEEELSVPLVQRSVRGAVPTEYGRALVPRVKIIESEIQRIRDEVLQMRGERKGVVAIGVSAGPAMIVPHVLKRFWQRHPDVRVHIVDGMQESTLADLRDGRLDFSIVPMELATGNQDLKVEFLMQTAVRPVVRKDHPKKHATSLKELSGSEWILSGSTKSRTNLIEGTFAKHRLRPPRLLVRCESFPALIALVSESNLIGILPESILLEPLLRPILDVLSIKEQFLPSRACLVTRAGTPMTPFAQILVREFRRFAKQELDVSP